MTDNPSAPPPDPYEYGFDVAQRRRLPIPELPRESEPGERRRRKPPRDAWKFAIGGLALVTAVAVGRGVQANRSGSLSPDCSRQQVKVAESSVVTRSAGLLHWSATAAGGERYVVALNARSVTLTGNVANAVPVVGGAGQASRLQTMPKGCLGHGVFGVLLPPGSYQVAMFRVDGSTITEVAQTTVKVTAS